MVSGGVELAVELQQPQLLCDAPFTSVPASGEQQAHCLRCSPSASGARVPCRFSLSGTPQCPQRASSHPLLEAPAFGATAAMEREGALDVLRVVARGFVAPPARTGSLGSWLSPQHPLQVHMYKQGELISRRCWAGLTHYRGAQPCPGAGRHRRPLVAGAGLWGAAAPGSLRQLSLARMPGCRGETGKLHQPCRLQIPAAIRQQGQ